MTRWARGAWLGGLLALAGCGESGTVAGPGGGVALLLRIAGFQAGEQVELEVYYLRNQVRVPLGADTVVAAVTGASQIPMDLDITDCLRDPARETHGAGCPVRITATLRSLQGDVLDLQSIGPIDAVPGGSVTAPSLTLRRFGTIRLTPGRDSLNPGETTVIQATVLDRGGNPIPGKAVLWRITPATVATISSAGIVSANSAGIATVTALAADDSTVTSQLTIPVRGVISVALAEDSIRLAPNGTTTPAATVTAIGASPALRWRSSTRGIVTVDSSSGLVTAVGLGRGVIVALARADSTKRDSVTIGVEGVVSVTVAPRFATLAPDGTITPTVTVAVAGPVPQTVSWSSANPGVATVTTTGLITAVGSGVTFVRAIATADPTKADSIQVVAQGPNTPAACLGVPVIKSGSIAASEVWTKAQSPYYVLSTVAVTDEAVLTIQPGARVCLGSGASLEFRQGGRLNAKGIVGDSIRFAPLDTTVRWGQLTFADEAADSSFLAFATLEWGGGGTSRFQPPAAVPAFPHAVSYESVRFRQWRGSLVVGSGRFFRSILDSVTASGYALALGPGAEFQSSTVRGADSVGVIAFGSGVRVLGGLIQGSGSVGLRIWNTATVTAAAPIRINGAGSYPVSGHLHGVLGLEPDSVAQSFWLGNARDTVNIDTGGGGAPPGVATDTLTVFGHLPWRMPSGTILLDDNSLLRIRPGGRLVMSPAASLSFQGRSRMEARGTLARPAVVTATDSLSPWSSLRFQGLGPAVPVFFTNALVEHGGQLAAGLPMILVGNGASDTSAAQFIMDSTVLRRGRAAAFRYDAGNSAFSWITRSRVEASGSGSRFNAAVALFGNVRLSSSVIRASTGVGIAIGTGFVDSVTVSNGAADGIELHGSESLIDLDRSNLFDNAGVGLRNMLVGFTFDAVGLWWGDGGGPLAPKGDGVGPGIVFTPVSTFAFPIVTPFP